MLRKKEKPISISIISFMHSIQGAFLSSIGGLGLFLFCLVKIIKISPNPIDLGYFFLQFDSIRILLTSLLIMIFGIIIGISGYFTYKMTKRGYYISMICHFIIIAILFISLITLVQVGSITDLFWLIYFIFSMFVIFLSSKGFLDV